MSNFKEFRIFTNMSLSKTGERGQTDIEIGSVPYEKG